MVLNVARRRPPPWIFAVAALPYGAFNGVIALALPYLLRRGGVPVSRIASAIAVIQAPAIWYFLWAPVVDLRMRRRTWVVLLSIVSGAFAIAALRSDVVTTLSRITVLFVVASVFNQPISSALGGLVASVVPEPLRSRTAGWGQAGNLGGGALAGGLALSVSSWSPSAMAIAVGALITLPAFAAFSIDEPPRSGSGFSNRLASVIAEIRSMATRRKVWFAFLLFLSPAGAGALMALFPAVAQEYGASTNTVIWGVGVGGAALMAAGALAAGFICERYDRWLVYPAVGVLSAISAGVMSLMPMTNITFVIGTLTYALVTGFGYAAFMAVALDLFGSNDAATGTQFTLCIAATNVPLVYMLWFDGLAHARSGVHGMLVTDAIANGVAGILLIGALLRYRR